MKFTEITISATNETEELVSDLLWNYTNYGVAICSQRDVRELITDRKDTFDYIDEKLTENLDSKESLIKAYISIDISDIIIPEIESKLNELKENCINNGLETGSFETIKRIVDGDDWIEIWRKHYKPFDLGKVVICPEWIDHKINDDQVMVKIGSNMAFGTGEHETTSMVIELLQEKIFDGCMVIDVGTGSGILGIASAKLGAGKVIMTDIDYVACESAKHNTIINGVDSVCQVALQNLLDDTSIKGDVVLANITADVLLILSNGILNNIVPNGYLIMSGIIKSRVEEVINRYQSLGFELEKRMDKGEWIALVMIKK